jgi:hypothetical protein
MRSRRPEQAIGCAIEAEKTATKNFANMGSDGQVVARAQVPISR